MVLCCVWCQTRVKKLEDVVTLGLIEDTAGGAIEFQAVVGCWVMTGCDLQATGGLLFSNLYTDGWRRHDAPVDAAAPARGYDGLYLFQYGRSAFATIVAKDDRTRKPSVIEKS
jgi:hypothetical protein